MSNENEKVVTPEPCNCQGCGEEFQSRNAVFKHLIDTNGACLDPEEYQNFRKYVLANRKRQKVIILYGYLPDFDVIKNGNDAAMILLKTLSAMYDEDELTEQQQNELLRINRSYGHVSRSTEITQQDEGTGAITEVLATRLPLEVNAQNDGEWPTLVNDAVAKRLTASSARLRVFGKLNVDSLFNAEMDVSHRRVEYLFPVDLLINFDDDKAPKLSEFFQKFPSLFDGSLATKVNYPKDNHKQNNIDEASSAAQDDKPDQETLSYLHRLKKLMQRLTTQIVESKPDVSGMALSNKKPPKSGRIQRSNDNKPQHLWGSKSRKEKVGRKGSLEESTTGESIDCAPVKKARSEPKQTKKKEIKNDANGEPKVKNTLQRKRYHNFTPLAMAHEYLCLRRMDRFFHRATLRFDTNSDPPALLGFGSQNRATRPFLCLSLTGDMFLNGQGPRIFGLFSALARGLIDEDFIECVLDDRYPHLVPTPPAPAFAMYAGEATYIKWEGKMQAVLSPRRQNCFKNGWNKAETVDAVESWTDSLREHVAQMWYKDGVEADGRLAVERRWTEDVLVPWAKKARKQLEHYRLWKAAIVPLRTETSNNADANNMRGLLPDIASIDPAVPPLFERVLFYLREADASGLWPATTPKRQLVMVSTLTDDNLKDGDNASAVAPAIDEQSMNAKQNDRDATSAYAYEEGQGGASGSFSVGAMPAGACNQPKGNTLFPELMKAAFELEIALLPDREPSSTIAINRNAQFRPHTDSGAGAGQSSSLIAGLGTYSGGELVVEGEAFDIRYKSIEFNGWKQRHWTMPFVGERYSLVWFTPKGCEGIHGIDLCR